MGFPIESAWTGLYIIGAEQIVVSTTVVALTPPRGAERILASATGAGSPTGLRMGSATALPTVSTGLVLPVNELLPLSFGDLASLRFIRDGAVDVTLDVLYVASAPVAAVFGNWAPPS